jgi:hypothetical protein
LGIRRQARTLDDIDELINTGVLSEQHIGIVNAVSIRDIIKSKCQTKENK